MNYNFDLMKLCIRNKVSVALKRSELEAEKTRMKEEEGKANSKEFLEMSMVPSQ